ncbi:hypothetical protein ACQ4PT_053394 [Festuca glaucescens]
MGDYSSTWSDGDNGYTGDDDSSAENSSKSRIYENVPPNGQNVPSSAYSENMSEYMYWEKVQPPGAPAFNPLVSMFPLMKNWTEVEGKKRDNSDAQYGRGKGNIDNDITTEHRLSKVNTANSCGRKTPVSRKAKTHAKTPPYMEQILERVNRMAGEITLVRKQIAIIAGSCAERVIAKLNKEGVIYSRDNKSTSEGDKESESSKKGAYSSKYFTSVHKDKDVDEDDVKEDELDNSNGTTPAPSVARKLMNDDPQPSVLFNCSKGDQTDPIQITNDLPARSSSSLSSSAFASARPNGPQKRKRMPSAKVRSPYLSEKNANKRQIREGKTPEGHFHSIDALLQVINAYVRHLSRRVPDDRVLSTTWRSTHLIEGRTRGRDYFPPDHPQVEIEKNRAVSRCMDEYFHRPKYYLAVNVNGNNWVTVVMHVSKKEFQVLDSLYVLRNYIDIIEALVLKCMEEWDGNEFRTSITQTLVDSTREVMVSEIIFSPSNELDSVKDKLLNPNGEEDDA